MGLLAGGGEGGDKLTGGAQVIPDGGGCGGAARD